MVTYPDLTDLPEEVAAAVVRLVRLVNQMRHRYPDLDRFALSVENDVDLRAAVIVSRHIEKHCRDFELLLSPWDGSRLMETMQAQGRMGEPSPLRRRKDPD
ncbi:MULTISPECIES: hypothetical protein [unclassified Azospirillum]|uniref:hypothetical protein n=1 Tax=unclassified Azospirillum TaxID=2630922 RepID=UPI000B6BAB06|nr:MULTISPECIES: hypothetical protein [unclassified Azospirillum]SNS96157.1 hypothetical protein SAMN05880556_11682 [Azospirillum sp. RU38E]SNT12647.1 hypothetical protein SAMN05880591_11682 [Azospirillum sp. RU37A]